MSTSVYIDETGFKLYNSTSGTTTTIIDASKTYLAVEDGGGNNGDSTIDITKVVDLSSNQDISGVKTFLEPIVGDLSGNADTVTSGVYTFGDQDISGVKTFLEPIVGDLSGNAASATTATTATSADACTGNAATATQLQTARSIAGVSFDGTNNILSGLTYDSVNTRLGIGTTSPSYKLDISGGSIRANALQGSSSNNLVLQCNKSDGVLSLQDSSGEARIEINGPGSDSSAYYDSASHNFRSYNGGTTYAVINSSGITANLIGNADTASAVAWSNVTSKPSNLLYTNSALGTPASGNLVNCTFPTLNQSTTGNAATATALTSGNKTIDGSIYLGTSANPIFRPATYYYQTYTDQAGTTTSGNARFYLDVNNTFTVTINNDDGNGEKDRIYIRPFNSGNASHFLTFTGQHRTFVNEVHHDMVDKYIGLIVCANKNTYTSLSNNAYKGNRAIQINESIPGLQISEVAYDKACFGVISGAEDPELRQEICGAIASPVVKELGDTRLFINSLGEGAVWIVNTNGVLESGDYITTSNVKGYGQKQDSEFLANYTVAKITMDCDFQPITQPVQIIKKEYGDVNYWVKTTYKTIDYETYSKLPEDKRLANTETVYTKDQNTISVSEYTTLDPTVQSTYNETIQTTYQEIIKEESKTEQPDYSLEVRQEIVNVLDEHGEFQWEDDPSGATEKAYQVRYLDANGLETDESNAVHIAAFVGCTYHCG